MSGLPLDRPEGDLRLTDDPFIMPVQARFFFSAGRLVVEDVGGANGVFVRLRQERELPVGGEVRLGRQRLVLEPIPAAAVLPRPNAAKRKAPWPN